MEHPPQAQVHLNRFTLTLTFARKAVFRCPQGCFTLVAEGQLSQHLANCVITKQEQQRKQKVFFVFCYALQFRSTLT